MGKQVLGDLIGNIDQVDSSLIVLVEDATPTSIKSHVSLIEFRLPFLRPVGMKYLMNVDAIKEVLEVWSAWRNGAVPTVEQATEAVIYYADHDCYLPVEEAEGSIK
jgi:hypothetical protein